MNRTNYHLIISNNNQDYYFYHEFVHTGDILRIGGYRVVVLHKQYGSPYTILAARLINEGETHITDLR